MTKDRSGRRVYRKSPGRQGGYGGLELAPRPDPRRTRQLMRQSILASKARTALYGEQEDEVQDQQAEQHESEEQEEYDDYDYEEDRPRIRRKAKEKNLSRRRLLVGLGTIAVGGAAVAAAAYELPKVPQAINDAGTNIEHQLQDAFNRGFSNGEDAVRREFITALDQLEGISLDAAVSAAKLTRVAYDVFVSPLVTFLANVADNFLTVT